MEGKKNPTIVEKFSRQERRRCIYCGSPDTNYNHNVMAQTMTNQDFNDLKDRGWSRLGRLVYKHSGQETCCPTYIIRSKVADYQLRKSHKKVIKRVNRYLITGDIGNDDDGEDSCGEEDLIKEGVGVRSRQRGNDGVLASRGKTSEELRKSDNSTTHEKKPPKPGAGADPNKPVCRKAKQVRLEKRLAKLKMAGNDVTVTEKEEQKVEEPTLEELLAQPAQAKNCAHKLEVRMYRTTSNEFRESLEESASLFHKFIGSFSNDHLNDFITFTFEELMVDSPLQEEYLEGGPAQGYGSFHQHYRLDGKLFAVGVIDLLPTGVFSLFLYYDVEFKFLGLATYCTLREIAFVRELRRKTPAMEYYYLGFYVHTAVKSRYKAQYSPSFLVCPETLDWVPLEDCIPLLEAKPYSRLKRDGKDDEDKVTEEDAAQALVQYNNSVMTYDKYRRTSDGKEFPQAKVLNYTSVVGKTLARRMVLRSCE